MHKRLNIFSNFFHQGRHIILVFLHQMVRQHSAGDASKGASSAGGMKNRDFRPIFRFISEIIQDRAIVPWKANRIYPSFQIWYHFQ